MAKTNLPMRNVFITEGQAVKKIDNVLELETILSEGGTATWVPAESIKLVPKVINKPGSYKASEEPGHPVGYSEITIVRNSDTPTYELGIKAITKDGTYISADEAGSPYYAYSVVIVNVPGG